MISAAGATKAYGELDNEIEQVFYYLYLQL